MCTASTRPRHPWRRIVAPADPEATFIIERMVNKLASTLGMDPVEVRKRNFVPRFENGHNVVTGLTYDSGDYPAQLEKLLAHVNYPELRREQEAARKADISASASARTSRLSGSVRRRSRRDWFSGWPLGKRHRSAASDGKGPRLHWRVTAWTRRSHVRAVGGERDRRRCRRREGAPRRHRRIRRWAGALTAAARRLSAAPR